MALKQGTRAPIFSLPDSEGELFHLKDIKSSVILYFYPKDFTPGCTKEACSFRDRFDFFETLNVPIVGISKDSIKKHRDFKKQYQLPFRLLSDIDGSVCKQYDALIPVLRMPKRITYLVDRDLTVRGVYDSLLGHESHIEHMAELLKPDVR